MYCILYSTWPDGAAAEAAAEALVAEGLVACCNILGGVRSVYRWDGKLQREDEVVMICKTRDDLAGEVTRRIVEMHTYDLPAVVRFDIAGGHGPFLEWIGEQVR